jgi:hypothetical protein
MRMLSHVMFGKSMERDEIWSVEWPWADWASSMGLSELRTEAGTGVQRVPGLGGSGQEGAFWGCKVPKMAQNRNFDGLVCENDDEIDRERHGVGKPITRAAR